MKEGRLVGLYAVASVRWRASAVSLDHPLFPAAMPIHKPSLGGLCVCSFLCVCAYGSGGVIRN